MKVLLTSAYPPERALTTLRACAAQDRFGTHQLTDNPEAADLILFVENAHYRDDPFYRKLLAHAWVHEYRDKVFMYNETDEPWCLLPGLYCSMPRRSFQHSRQRAFCYLYSVNESLGDAFPQSGEPDFLFSFMGAANHAVRRAIFRLEDPRGHIENTSSFSVWNQNSAEQLRARQQTYTSVMERSKFILCPRGVGTSSYRLFETMQAGRAPVVLADQWVEPEGPPWHQFLLRVRERDVPMLPDILRRHEEEAAVRGRLARRAWEEWFAPDVRFHRAVEACAELLERRRISEALASRIPCRELHRFRTRRALRQLRDRIRSGAWGRSRFGKIARGS